MTYFIFAEVLDDARECDVPSSDDSDVLDGVDEQRHRGPWIVLHWRGQISTKLQVSNTYFKIKYKNHLQYLNIQNICKKLSFISVDNVYLGSMK